ncbi:DUF433 domain-containing protein [Fibrella sp. WM1]|uniref:DUF433 domain-containing protein n=1 Tax=Fibrella musci TaxID=3242485 RepID=UPI0035219FD0
MDSLLHRITLNPAVCHGKPTIRHSRVMVATILELLSAGSTFDELKEDYPNLEEDDVRACLAYATRLVNFQFIPHISAA